MGVADVVGSGPLLLAIPVAAAAGAVTFLSPCCLPLVPGYLSYATGMSGADATQAAAGSAGAPSTRARTVAGTMLFVLGFSVVFATYGTVLGGLGQLLRTHDAGLTQLLGGFTILLGLVDVVLDVLLVTIYQPSAVLQIVAGLLVFAFVAEGIYLYFHVMSLAFGGKGLPLGKPLIQA